MMATLVTGGTIVTANTTFQTDLLVEGERIIALSENLDASDIKERIDATGCYVMPGAIDVHTHLNLELEATRVSDGFYHGSLAAAHGGTTCIVEHPGFGPTGCALQHQVEHYRNRTREEMVVDYGFHGVVQHVDAQVCSAIKPLIAGGIPSLKVYLTYGGRLNDAEILEVLRATGEAGGLTTFHAENHAIITHLTKTLKESGDLSDPNSHPRSRPDYCEAEAVGRLIALAQAAGNVPIYIVHLSTAAGLEVIREAQKKDLPVIAETCPQYLLLTEDCYREPDGKGLQYIMAPPLRTQQDCDALWEGLADGTIEVVATDHCSFSFAQKLERGSTNIFDAPGGIPGIETRVPLLFSEGVLKNRLSLNRFVQLVATNPARIMGLSPQKGEIAIGADADLMILDPAQKKQLSAQDLHQQVDYTPFAGMTVTGWPTTVMLRGNVLVRGGEFIGEKGFGKFIKRRNTTGGAPQ